MGRASAISVMGGLGFLADGLGFRCVSFMAERLCSNYAFTAPVEIEFKGRGLGFRIWGSPKPKPKQLLIVILDLE